MLFAVYFNLFYSFFLDIFDVSPKCQWDIFHHLSDVFFCQIFILLSLAWHPSRTKALPSLKLAANAPENMVSQKESSFQTIIFRSYVRHHFSSLAQINFLKPPESQLKAPQISSMFVFLSPHVKPLGDGWKFNSGSLRFVSGFRANKKNLIQLGRFGLDRFDPVFYRWSSVFL